MNCHEVERFVNSRQRPTVLALPEPVRAHTRDCPVCRGLIDLLTAGDPAPQPPAALLRKLEQQVAQDLKPVKPLRPPGTYAAGFAAWFLALAVVGGWQLKPLALGVMSPWLCATVWLALGISAALLIGSLLGQMAPGSLYRINPGWLPVGVLAALGGFFSTVLPHRAETDFWRLGWVCLVCGLSFFAPAAVVFWLLLRRGALLSARLAGATLGLLAGLTGTTVLEIHCPLQTAWHVVMWHLGVPFLTTLACLALALVVERTLATAR